MYKVKLSKKSQKFFIKHKSNYISKNIYFAIEILKKNPYINKLDIKKLKWTINIYRLRVWDYRLLYEINDNELIIFCIDIWNRWDIYK